MLAPIRSVVVLALLLQPLAARGSCNVIPQAALGFRGIRGQVDRPFIVAGDAGSVLTLRAECGSPDFADTNHDGVVDRRDIKVGVFKREATTGAIVPGDGICPRVKDAAKAADVKCVAPDEVALALEMIAGERLVRLQVPKTGFAGPASVVVVPSDSDFPPDLSTKGCAGATLGTANVCIDDLFRADIDSCGVTAKESDLTFAAFTVLSTWNDYQELCTDDFGVKPKCKGTADSVWLTLDARGDALLPVEWTNILRYKKKSPEFDRRLVRGSTAIEAFKGGKTPIVIPGGEFLESYNPIGLLFDQKPLFVPVELLERGNEVTLFGNADKARSILRISRRKLWPYACDGGVNQDQACDPAPQDHTGEDDCPAASCVADLPLRYYFCDAGDRQGLPCARPFQCPKGACVAGSVCKGGSSAGNPCTIDPDCPSGECGACLFELRDRATANELLLPRTVGTFAGICDGGDDDGDRCGSTCYNFPLSFNSCVTYRGEAVIYAP